jgi:manganese/iron transport system ATP-binding protein
MSEIVNRLKSHGIEHQDNAPTLEVRNVSVIYAGGSNGAMTPSGQRTPGIQYALHEVDFQIQAGQQVAIVGPNGAGKSTLLKVIVGTLKPSKGTVNIFGHDPDCHICIAYVPQSNQIDWNFPVTVEDTVMMGRIGQIGLFRWPRRRDWRLVRESLERVNAGHLRKKQIGELSGGQQQRVFIARALAQGADLLLLDEPFSGLDAPSHEAILEILDSLRSDGVTILVATHDLNLAAERFDQVMLLNRRIVAFDEPAAVLNQNNLTQAFGGHMHIIEGEGDSLLFADSCCDHGDEHL